MDNQSVINSDDFFARYIQITEDMKKGHTMEQVLEKILAYFESEFTDTLCTIMVVNKDQTRFLNIISTTFPEDLADLFKAVKIYEGSGTCGTAVATNQLVVTKDIKSDTKWKAYRHIIKQYPISSCWSKPIYSAINNRVVATFAMYTKEERDPTKKELEMINGYHDLISLVISQYLFSTEVLNDGSVPNILGTNSEMSVASIRNGINDQEFEPYFQPIVNKDRSIYGVEALARWNHPMKGILSPPHFVEFAEEYDIIDEIDKLIIRKACEKVVKLNEGREKPLYLSVNVSAKHLALHDFVSFIEQTIDETGFVYHHLCLEITETHLISDMESVSNKLLYLKELGVRIYLDDFGIAYSSLHYLKKFPVSSIKIDRSFMEDITQNFIDKEIYETIIHLAKNLNIQVITEGIETPDQFELLIELDANLFQGYLFSKPIPFEELEGYLLAQ
ncbi:EAL domain-containing protein [Gracilibacillus xinjiangensis]|uniref:EAL domain-containing protein n=1 Tax=Gracilibacillus xinjiangensis TaxID=1193282 RepID=A0ABV8WT14_9BACI